MSVGRRPQRIAVGFLIATALCAAAASRGVAQGKAPITHEAMWLLPRVGAPATSPDGKWVVFPVTEPAYDDKDQRSDLWIVPADGTAEPRRLTSTKAGESSIAWSPDSRQIAFVARRDGDENNQIYTLDVTTSGEASRVTSLYTGAGFPAWRPDGKAILFTSLVYPGAANDAENCRIAEERQKRQFNVRAFDTFPIRRWDRWLDDRQLHVFVQELAAGAAAKDLLAGTRLVQDPMFIAAGEIVARVVGRTWDDYVRHEFFDPLGMRRTVTSVGALAGNDNVATPHAAFEGALRTFPWISWDNAGPAGSIVSSVSDMAAWMRLQLGRGTLEGRTYFSDSASRVMWTPHVSFTVDQAVESRIPSTQFRGYGLGWSLSDYRGRLVASHGGAVDGMFSNVTLVPRERLGIVVLTNSDSDVSGALPYRVIDEYVGGQERDWSGEARERARARISARDAERESVARARVQGTKPSLALEAYAGTYPSDLYGDARVTVESGRLVLRLVPSPELIADLTHWHFDTFALIWRRPWPWFGGGRVQFVLDQNARINELKLDVPNDDFWFWEPRFLRATDGR